MRRSYRIFQKTIWKMPALHYGGLSSQVCIVQILQKGYSVKAIAQHNN